MDVLKKLEKFSSWCKKNGLKLEEALNLCFVPMSTYDDMRYSKAEYIPPLRRIYILSEIKEFELYMSNHVNSRAKEDEVICKFLIDRWRKTKELPADDEKLSITTRKTNPKPVVGALIKKRYFSKINSENTEESNSFLSNTTKELLNVLSGSDYQIATFKKLNEANIKKMLRLLNIFLQDNPKESYKLLENYKNNLNT
jgi:hypothetical protein